MNSGFINVWRWVACFWLLGQGVVPVRVDRNPWIPDVTDADLRAQFELMVGLQDRLSEVADAVMFLASDEASYITGQVLAADGGFEATGIGLPALRTT